MTDTPTAASPSPPVPPAADSALTVASGAVRAVPRLDRAGALRKWNDLRLQGVDLFAQAARVAVDSKLGDLHVQQMRAAYGIGGLKLHEPPVTPSGEDARKTSDDLYALARVFDPLPEAMGREAKRTLGIDYEPEHWEGLLRGAFDGNATRALHDVADELDEEEDERWT